MMLRADGRIVFVPISRNGDSGECSESDEKDVMVGAVGEPSDFFDRKPAWKRLERGFRSMDVCGGVGIGEESVRSGSAIMLERVGGGISIDEVVGVVSICSGVAWNSATSHSRYHLAIVRLA